MLAMVYLNIEDEEAEDKDLDKGKKVEEEHLIRFWSCSIVMVGGHQYLII